MADNELPIVPDAIDIVTHEIINAPRQALLGDVVPRAINGSPVNNAGDLGRSNLQWRRLFAENIFVGGLSLAQFIAQVTAGGGNGISLANHVKDGTAYFLRKGAGTLDLQVVGTVPTPLKVFQDNVSYSITATINQALTGVPAITASSNTSGISNYGPAAKAIGENPGGKINLATGAFAGLTPLETFGFKVTVGAETDYFLGQLSADRSYLTNCIKGVGRLTENITRVTVPAGTHLVSQVAIGAVFLRANLGTPDFITSYRMPRFVQTVFATTDVNTNDTAWDAATEKWYQFDGTTWNALQAVFVGFVFIEGGAIVATAPVWRADPVVALRGIPLQNTNSFTMANLDASETAQTRLMYFGYINTNSNLRVSEVSPYYVSSDARLPGFFRGGELIAQRLVNIGGFDYFHPSGTEIMHTNFIRRNSDADLIARDWDLRLQTVSAEPGSFGSGSGGGSCGDTLAFNTNALLHRRTRNTSTPPVHLGGPGALAFGQRRAFVSGGCGPVSFTTAVPLLDLSRYSI